MPESHDLQPLIWKPVSGVNSELNESAIEPTECTDARNFLIERGQASSRPGLSSLALTGPIAGLTILYASSLIVGAGNATISYTFFYTTTNRLFVITGGSGATTELTLASGHALLEISGAIGNRQFTPFAVNQAVIFPQVIDSVTVQTIRWVPGAGNLSLITATMGLAGTSHLSRGVMAGFPFIAGGPYTVAWSKAGDETVWNTNPSTDGSGSSLLADVPGRLTGLRTVNNTVVLLHETGLQLGFPTGIALPAFRWESYMRERIGLPIDRCTTLAVDDNELFWVSTDNVYMFDLSNINPVGDKIKSSLINQFVNGVSYSGFITRSVLNGGNFQRRRYHLFPISGAVSGTPHYVYDLDEKSWAIHDYTQGSQWAFTWNVSVNDTRLAFIDGAGTTTVRFWDAAVAPDRSMYLITAAQRPNDYSRDYTIERVLLNTRDFGATAGVQLTLTGQYGTVAASITDTQTVGANNNGKWTRKWFNMRGPVGQDIQARLDVPANNKFSTDTIWCEISEQGVTRG